jgi:hypothetical protein
MNCYGQRLMTLAFTLVSTNQKPDNGKATCNRVEAVDYFATTYSIVIVMTSGVLLRI